MRTTLDIADDVLTAAKELAQMRRKTTGAVISELARVGLSAPLTTRIKAGAAELWATALMRAFRPATCAI